MTDRWDMRGNEKWRLGGLEKLGPVVHPFRELGYEPDDIHGLWYPMPPEASVFNHGFCGSDQKFTDHAYVETSSSYKDIGFYLATEPARNWIR